MNSDDLITMARKCHNDVWVGEYGYDTRPYIEGYDYLPVRFSVGFADGRPSEEYPEEGLEEFFSKLQEGDIIVFPDFLGSTHLWDYDQRFIKGPDSWLKLENTPC